MASSLKSLLGSGGAGVPIGGAVDFMDVAGVPPLSIESDGSVFLRGGYGVVTGTPYTDFFDRFNAGEYKIGSMALTYSGDDNVFNPYVGAYGGGTYIAAGYEENGKVAVSDDNGNTWAFYDVTGASEGDFEAAAFGSDTFLLFHGPDVFASTDNGRSWIANRAALPNDGKTGAIFDGTAFLVAGYNGGLWRSTDAGATWVALTNPAAKRQSVFFSDGAVWLAAGGQSGNLIRSTNGSDWTAVADPFGGRIVASMVKVLSPNKIVCVCTDGTVYTSVDGIAWASNTSVPGTAGVMCCFKLSDEYMYALAANGTAYRAYNTTVISWAAVESVPGGRVTAYVQGDQTGLIISNWATFIAVVNDGLASLAVVPPLVANGYARYVRVK